MNKPLLLLVAALLVIGAGNMVGSGTQALFTDTAASTSNVFTSGVVDLTLAGLDNVTNTVSFSAPEMVPGNAVTAPAGGLQVTNNDTTTRAVELRYAVTALVAADSAVLSKRLDLEVGRRSTTGTCDATATYGTTQVAATAWILIYQGDLADSAVTELKLIGDKAAGQTAFSASQQSGDRILAAAASEFFCFRVTFVNTQDRAGAAAVTGERGTTANNYVQDDVTAAEDNAYQNLTATITFTFYAEQTANNP